FPAYTCHISCPENNTQIDPIHEHLTRRDRRYVLPAGICNDCHLAAHYVYPPEGIQIAADQFILICCLFFLSAQISITSVFHHPHTVTGLRMAYNLSPAH